MQYEHIRVVLPDNMTRFARRDASAKRRVCPDNGAATAFSAHHNHVLRMTGRANQPAEQPVRRVDFDDP
jgi:hypothetical protein